MLIRHAGMLSLMLMHLLRTAWSDVRFQQQQQPNLMRRRQAHGCVDELPQTTATLLLTSCLR